MITCCIIMITLLTVMISYLTIMTVLRINVTHLFSFLHSPPTPYINLVWIIPCLYRFSALGSQELIILFSSPSIPSLPTPQQQVAPDDSRAGRTGPTPPPSGPTARPPAIDPSRSCSVQQPQHGRPHARHHSNGSGGRGSGGASGSGAAAERHQEAVPNGAAGEGAGARAGVGSPEGMAGGVGDGGAQQLQGQQQAGAAGGAAMVVQLQAAAAHTQWQVRQGAGFTAEGAAAALNLVACSQPMVIDAPPLVSSPRVLHQQHHHHHPHHPLAPCPPPPPRAAHAGSMRARDGTDAPQQGASKRQRRELEPQQSNSPTAARHGEEGAGNNGDGGVLGSALPGSRGGGVTGAGQFEASPDLGAGQEATMASGDAGSGQHGGSGESSGDKRRQSSVPSQNALLHSNGGSGSGGGNTGPRSGAGSNPQVIAACGLLPVATGAFTHCVSNFLDYQVAHDACSIEWILRRSISFPSPPCSGNAPRCDAPH